MPICFFPPSPKSKEIPSASSPAANSSDWPSGGEGSASSPTSLALTSCARGGGWPYSHEVPFEGGGLTGAMLEKNLVFPKQMVAPQRKPFLWRSLSAPIHPQPLSLLKFPRHNVRGLCGRLASAGLSLRL